MEFLQIKLPKHRHHAVAFRRDSFIASFGSDQDFGAEDEYLNWLKEQCELFPSGFVLVYENGIPIGQLELTLREFEGKKVGYVNLYYLIPEKRGLGIGQMLHRYALEFFKQNHMKEYHLRVSPSNEKAMSFYMKNGMKKIRSELEGKVIRMSGYIE
ncbi:GNAT family N-acetyltransferase [Mesobacillus zeae]|uniref:GNAT family N-acetyltransferase n=1 Tax=Mesobacillus zeae TaxID=1917180 RepID=A0A398AZ79_9BACI|nr:GNAT family N-acetyltransferase [Mesobacillus zeae]